MKANNLMTMARLRPNLLKSKQNIQSKCGRFIRKDGLIYIYVFIPLPLAAAIGPDVGKEASMKLDRQVHTTGQTFWSMGVRNYAEEEKGKKNCLPLSTPVFYAGVFQRNQILNNWLEITIIAR